VAPPVANRGKPAPSVWLASFARPRGQAYEAEGRSGSAARTPRSRKRRGCRPPAASCPARRRSARRRDLELGVAPPPRLGRGAPPRTSGVARVSHRIGDQRSPPVGGAAAFRPIAPIAISGAERGTAGPDRRATARPWSIQRGAPFETPLRRRTQGPCPPAARHARTIPKPGPPSGWSVITAQPSHRAARPQVSLATRASSCRPSPGARLVVGRCRASKTRSVASRFLPFELAVELGRV